MLVYLNTGLVIECKDPVLYRYADALVIRDEASVYNYFLELAISNNLFFEKGEDYVEIGVAWESIKQLEW